ncbi:hypothetical protein GQ43DRAFT_76364 [Delitschia confertaspora ATCC 74209]|uniref:Uncharacterized protein n=1 Tax=Delitschia confertaspora ATCC 74209 TaxID=1513339 RepID=A0A9P4JTK7_9PLEO|nr:hypothetical protein GQ43DRAFT_76364 [Delitschia confertaspora ATCC 74209]
MNTPYSFNFTAFAATTSAPHSTQDCVDTFPSPSSCSTQFGSQHSEGQRLAQMELVKTGIDSLDPMRMYSRDTTVISAQPHLSTRYYPASNRPPSNTTPYHSTAKYRTSGDLVSPGTTPRYENVPIPDMDCLLDHIIITCFWVIWIPVIRYYFNHEHLKRGWP